jgi:hypothetical protein
LLQLQRRLMVRLKWLADGMSVRLFFALGSFEPIPRPFSSSSPAAPTIVPPKGALRHELDVVALLLRPYEWHFWVVLTLSAAVMATLQCYAPFWYGGADHADYLNYGYYLLGELPLNALPQWRTPGMGIFHVLSGTVLLDTWWGYRMICALLGATMPVLTYLMVRPYSHTFALLAGLVTILSMTPYVYAFQPLTEHVFFFFHAVVLLLCVSYLIRRADFGYKLPIAIALAAAYLTMVRPVGAIIFWIFVAIAAVSRPRSWRRLAAGCCVYLAIMAAWVVWDRDYGGNLGAMPGNFFPLPSSFTTKAERRLAQAYFAPAGLTHALSDAAAKGYPHSMELRALLRRYLNEHPEKWQPATYFTPKSLFAVHASEPDKLLDALFADRNSLYFGFLVRSAQDADGPEAGLSLLHDVATEHGTTGLRGWVSAFVSDPTRLFFGTLPKFSARMMVKSFHDEPHSTVVVGDFPESILTPDLGPATTRLLAIMRNFIFDYPQYCEQAAVSERDHYRRVLKKCPDDYYQAIITKTSIDNTELEGDIWSVLTWYLGFAPSQRLYAEVAAEVDERYPQIVLLFYDNLLRKSLLRYYGPINGPSTGYFISRSDAYFFTPRVKQYMLYLPPGLASELEPILPTSGPWMAAAAFHAAVYLIAPLFIFILVLALPFYRSPTTTAACGFLLVIYLQELIAISLLSPQSVPRYEATFYLLPLVIACMIFGQAYSNWSKSRKQSLSVK